LSDAFPVRPTTKLRDLRGLLIASLTYIKVKIGVLSEETNEEREI
jgi:hypothetical protein